MITSLAIKNYALIEDIRVDFHSGLTIITGETGAGKSILLGALGLVLGNRADLKVVKDGQGKCVIEAEFAIADYQLEALFRENDLDYEAHTILRREILPSGKSRAFVNDTPATLQQMQILGERLIDVHSQNETQSLLREHYQMEVVDALANNGQLLASYRDTLEQFKGGTKRLEELVEEKEQAAKELDYHTFLHKELVAAQLEGTDQQDLEEQYEKLNHAEEILMSLGKLRQVLLADDTGSLASVNEARSLITSIRGFSSEYQTLWERLNSVMIELEDISEDVERASEDVDADPVLLEEVNEKLQRLHSLQQKHLVSSVPELIQIEKELAGKIDTSSTIDARIEQLQVEVLTTKKELETHAVQLNKNRTNAVPALKEKLEVFLGELGLPNAQFHFEFNETEEFRSNGNAELEVLFTANKGAKLGPLSRVASGGEMSRIMLAVKAV
ncbi:MAG: AAA family ATPase, partial [Bacteroidota bacterium]